MMNTKSKFVVMLSHMLSIQPAKCQSYYVRKWKEELNRMQSMWVISSVDNPSTLCAGMVVVPKPAGDVPICVDLKPLSQNVLREYHPLPNVDETLEQLAGTVLRPSNKLHF